MSILSEPIIWPPIEEELAPYLKYCRGLVLNAGAGRRDIQLGKRDLNIDIVPETQPDIIADLHAIPLRDDAVDTIVSIAVLEHTRYPWIVAEEFYRVLKPGGYGVINVPFLQPQHACPSDYIRFTENGLVELMKYVGFEVVQVSRVHHFGQTIAWMLWKYVQENVPQNKLQYRLWHWLVGQLSKGTFLGADSSDTHNSHYIIVRKPGSLPQTAEAKALLQDNSKTWFFPLLACPSTRQPLHRKDNHLMTADEQFTYPMTAHRPTLLPKTDPGTWKTLVARQGELAFTAAQVASAGSTADSTATAAEAKSEPQRDATTDAAPALKPAFKPELHFLSQQAFGVSFKSPYAEQLRQANPDKIAILATTEYEGIFKNGGVGTHYKTLSEQLTRNGWHVILFICNYAEQKYGGTSPVEAVKNVFAIHELYDVLNLQPVHEAMLKEFAGEWKHWIDHPSFASLLFNQAIAAIFPDLPIYVEFHEMLGTGYYTIQAKQSRLLGPNWLIGVTMHSGHEWIYEANEWFVEEYLAYHAKVCDYEKFTFENADLTFFPSHYLKQKVESYGWQTAEARHMPYFVPILPNAGASTPDDAGVAAALKHPRDKVPVIFFGRLEMRKGIMTFVEAIKRLSPEIRSQIHVHFVGKVVRLNASKYGDLESDRYVQQELEDKVTYTLHPDFYSHQAIQFIRSLRSPIVCLASHQENFPNTGLEMGQLPVSLVVSDTGGFRETLGFVNRQASLYWFKPADPIAMSDMLSKAFFNQPELPEVPSSADLEAINRQLWDRKLSCIEAAFDQERNKVELSNDQPKITVGITCYNSGQALIDCLTSVELQAYNNLEVIVLDNASSDRASQQAIEEAKAIFQTYRFVRSDRNLEPGAAQNHLIELAEGDYFLPLEAEHHLVPFAVETLVNAAVHAKAEVVISPRVFFGADARVDVNPRLSSVATLLQTDAAGDVCGLFSTSLLRKFQAPERRDCKTQNWCLLSAAIATGAQIIHYPYPLYEYRLCSDSMIETADLPKERYYLRQYLAQIPPAEWSSRQIGMLMLAVQELQAQQEKCQTQVQQAQAETQRVQAELEAMKQKLQQARGNVRGTRDNLEQTQTELQQAKDRIHAMETSKFWKLRQGWFKIKQRLNLPSNE